MIGDPGLFEVMEGREVLPLSELVARAVRVKVAVVQEDPFEQGRRAALNLGHTFGHAFETLSGYRLRHGEAVSIGLAAATRLAARLALCEPALVERVESALDRLGLPVRAPGFAPEQIMAAMGADKKRVGRRLRFVLPRAIGDVDVFDHVEASDIVQTLARRHPAMNLARRSNLALAAIVVVYFAFGVAHLARTPLFEKPDEEWHAAYVYYLLEQRRLPPLVIDAEQNPAVQIAGHPPLYYAAAASLLRATGLTQVPPALQANPFWGYPALGTTPDNKNRFLHTAGELGDPRYRPLYLLRGLSLLLGVGAVFAAYGIGLALTQQMALALMSAALVAVLPQYSFIASSVSNDALVATLSGLGLLALLHACTPGASWRPWVWFGLLAGLAALTKTSALLLPLFGAGVAVVIGVQRRSWRAGAIGVASSLGLWLLLAGWWYARNFLQFDDPLGVGVHVTAYGRSAAAEGWRLLDQWRRTSVTFWAAFGWSNVQFPGWIYATLRALEALALAGLLAYLVRGRHRLANGTMWAVALGYTGLTVVAYLWWTTTVTGTLGRLLFPVLAPLAVLIVRGLSYWSYKALAAAWSFVAVIALLALSIIPLAYRMPATTSGRARNGRRYVRDPCPAGRWSGLSPAHSSWRNSSSQALLGAFARHGTQLCIVRPDSG